MVNFYKWKLKFLGSDLDSMTELYITLQAISAVDCNSAPFGSSFLSENFIVRDGNFRVFGGLPKPGFRHGLDIWVGRVC